MTWSQLGRHSKPMVFANIAGFWDPMLSLLNHMQEEGFLHTLDRLIPTVVSDPDEIVGVIQNKLQETFRIKTLSR